MQALLKFEILRAYERFINNFSNQLWVRYKETYLYAILFEIKLKYTNIQGHFTMICKLLRIKI